MEHQKVIGILAKDSRMSDVREIIIDVAGIITRQNIEILLSGRKIPDGIRDHLNRIRELMKVREFPTLDDDTEFYNKIIQPAYLEIIRIGG